MTDSSQIQTFSVPTGATRLFLGFADAPYALGDVGHYQDNAGSLNVGVTLVPESTTAAMVMAGMALMAAIRCWAECLFRS